METDVCIIGAGAAGITLALELVGTPLRVCLLESGGLELDTPTQQLYQGETVGHPYYPLEACRLRYLAAPPTIGPAASSPSTHSTYTARLGAAQRLAIRQGPAGYALPQGTDALPARTLHLRGP